MTQLYSVRFHQLRDDMTNLEDGYNKLRRTGPARPLAGNEVAAAAPGEVDDCVDALRRVQADFESYRKRVRRRQGEEAERGVEALMERLLPVLDAFELGLRS